MTARREFLAGVRDALPLALGGAPFGLLYGTLVTSNHLPALVGQSMSFILYAGSAQVVIVPLLAAGTPALIVIGIALVINLRHALYSAALAPHMRPLGRPLRMLLAYLLTDEAFAVTITRYQSSVAGQPVHVYLLGAGLTWWLEWQIGTAAGIFVGGQMPANWPLDFAMPLMFIGLAVPMIKDRASLLAAVLAGVLALGLAGLPYKLGLVLATLIGVGAGMLADARLAKRKIQGSPTG
ncbi:MAG: AzlC family ABC transporter permease [Chloroflexi bacterium]|nr:AzlC family ABC transporter permease [Chloroflexota bacterium]